MTLGKRDRRALTFLGVAAALVLLVEIMRDLGGQAPAAAAADSVPMAERRLAKARQLAATLPAREAERKVASGELATREKGVLQAETLAQAQAQLLQIARRLTAAQSPPIEIRNVELGQTHPLGDDYAELTVPVSFTCRIEQLLNLLADLTAQPEMVAAGGLRVTAGDQKEKTINVRLTFSGVAPRRLMPQKKEAGLP
jgi:hypothetical protein